MANNKVVLSNGTTIMDISDTTAVASDVTSGKYFYSADGVKTLGTASIGGPTTKIIVPEQTLEISQAYTEITNRTEDLIEGEDYIYTVNGVSATVTAHVMYGSLTVPLDTNYRRLFEQSGNNLYFDVLDTSNYGTYTIKLEKVVLSDDSMNVQAYIGYDTVNATSYTATDVTLTVAKTGTYTVSWMGYRNTTSGTSGSQLYVNGTARDSAQTSFVNSYGQSVVLTNQSLNEGDVLVVRAISRNTSYYMGVGNLIIQQTA